MAEKQDNQGVQVKVEAGDEQGSYANAVSVHVNRNEVILDFGYILPNMKPTTIKVVNRINLSHATAESFLKVLSNAMLDWRNKQKESEGKSEK
jgi:flagellar hook-basal body complex protein FliE